MSNAEGMDSGIGLQSMMSGNFGTSFNSGVDLDNSSFDLRLTLGLKHKLERRSTTGGNVIPEDSRESCESINNRAS